MKKEIFMSSFIFCSMHEMPIIGNDCQGCEFLIQEDEIYYCTHMEPDEDDD